MAQTAGNVNTSLMKIFIGGASVSCLTDAGISFSMSPRDVTCKDSGDYNDYLGGQISWECSGSGLFAFDSSNGFDALFTAYKAKTKVAVAWGTANPGDFKYGGNAFITKLDGSASGTNGNSTYSFTMMGVGEPVKTVVS